MHFKLSGKRLSSANARSEKSGSGCAGRCGLEVPDLQVCSLAARGCAFQYPIKELEPEQELEVFYPMEASLPSAVPQTKFPANRSWTGGFVLENYRSAWDRCTGTKAKTS